MKDSYFVINTVGCCAKGRRMNGENGTERELEVLFKRVLRGFKIVGVQFKLERVRVNIE